MYETMSCIAHLLRVKSYQWSPCLGCGAPLLSVSLILCLCYGLISRHSNTLILRSTIPTTSPQFQALASPTSRVSALAALPPLPSPIIVPLKPEYPIFNIPAPQTELPFPSQPQRKPHARPILSTPRL